MISTVQTRFTLVVLFHDTELWEADFDVALDGVGPSGRHRRRLVHVELVHVERLTQRLDGVCGEWRG